jgi:hypothetical protein
MPLRLSADQAFDLLTHSSIRVFAPAGGGRPVVAGRTPGARQVLRRRMLSLAARVGARYLTGIILGMLFGWTATALWVLAH